eukprot:3226047-Prymnesium_polylepis.1
MRLPSPLALCTSLPKKGESDSDASSAPRTMSFTALFTAPSAASACARASPPPSRACRAGVASPPSVPRHLLDAASPPSRARRPLPAAGCNQPRVKRGGRVQAMAARR